ncbi:MAG: nucleotidyltransferase family protein, partial [Terriglobales bacterium]
VGSFGPHPSLELYPRLTHEEEFVRGAARMDVHWQLPLRHRLVYEEIAAHAVPFAVAGQEVAVLPRELQFVHLCAHGLSSYWTRLSLLMDVAMMLKLEPPLVWPEVMRWARLTGAVREVELAVTIAHDLLGSELPQDIEPTARICALAAEIKRDLDSCIEVDHFSRVNERKFRYHLATAQSPAALLALALEGIFKPTLKDWRALKLPPKLFWCYYPLRPVRLLAEAAQFYGRKLWFFIVSDSSARIATNDQTIKKDINATPRT